MEVVRETAGAAAGAPAPGCPCHLTGGDFSESLCPSSVIWQEREKGQGMLLSLNRNSLAQMLLSCAHGCQELTVPRYISDEENERR